MELEIKDATDTDMFAWYLNLQLKNENGGRLWTKLYNKRDDFNFPVVFFSHLYV